MPTILDKIVEHKKTEIAAAKSRISFEFLTAKVSSAPVPRDFLNAIVSDPGVSLIAEVKKASPSKGVIREDFNPTNIASTYAQSGATCISVLTDENFFQGHLDYLIEIRTNVDLPILRKDFIIDPYQVVEARVAGADAVLLIAECLTMEELHELHDLIVKLGMTPLVELYDPANIESVVACGAKLIGINNRDLNTFETDLQHCVDLRKRLPDEATVVGESGIFNADDVAQLKDANIDAMLVGESLMRASDISAAVKAILKSN